MKCGFYEAEITPPLGTTIFGYPNRRKALEIVQKLYAKAAVFEKDGEYAALLALDYLSIPEGLLEIVADRVTQYTDIKPENIIIGATHSHTSGPTVGNLGEFRLGKLTPNEPELDAELDKKAIEMASMRAADAITAAYQRLTEVEIKFGCDELKNVGFVREHILKDGTIRTNPGWEEVKEAVSDPDTRLPVFYVTDKENGKPLGIITSYALHHDTTGGNRFSSDWSGYVATSLKESFGNDFVSLFFNGFSGNVNHLNYYKFDVPRIRKTKDIADIIAKAIIKIPDKAQLVADSVSVKVSTIKINRRALPEDILIEARETVKKGFECDNIIATNFEETFDKARAFGLVEAYDNDETEVDIPLKVIKIGDCYIYSTPGEMFGQFAEMIYKDSPSKNNLLISLANACSNRIGYVLPPQLIMPTVYESIPSSSLLEPEAGNIMVNKLLEVAKEM